MRKKFKHLQLAERIKIREMIVLEKSFGQIAQELHRNKSSIQREVSPWRREKYDPLKAQRYADKLQALKKKNKYKLRHEGLLNLVVEKLHLYWSPEQIAHWLKGQFPVYKTMQLSHETLYLYVYLRAKKGLRQELIRYLRRQKKKRYRPAGKKSRQGKIPNAVSIDERPSEVIGRQIAGHWEGDLIIGKGHHSALGTLTERTTRTIILVPLQSQEAPVVRESFEKEFVLIPQQMKKTLTYDNGKEMSEHELFTQHTQVQVYFAHPFSPWERPTNENSNGLIRQYFPKGTDFSKVSPAYIKQVQHQLNERPRKVLNWKTPKEVFEKCILEQIK